MKKPDARIIELCDRLTSAGSAQHKLSASELHELADYIYGLRDGAGESSNPDAPIMLRKEILNTVRRYGRESDVTVYQALGVLEIIKVDLVKMLEAAQEQK